MIIKFDGVALDKNSIMGLNQNAQLFNGQFKLGSTVCRVFNLSVAISEASKFNNVQNVQICDDSNNIEHSLLIDSIDKENSTSWNYTLIDRMVLLNTIYDWSGLANPTLQNILNAICSNVLGSRFPPTLSNNIKNIKLPFDNNIMARDFVSWCAELDGRFAYISALGDLVFKVLNNGQVRYDIDIDSCEDYTIGEYHKITEVIFRKQDGSEITTNVPVKYDTNEQELIIENASLNYKLVGIGGKTKCYREDGTAPDKNNPLEFITHKILLTEQFGNDHDLEQTIEFNKPLISGEVDLYEKKIYEKMVKLEVIPKSYTSKVINFDINFKLCDDLVHTTTGKLYVGESYYIYDGIVFEYPKGYEPKDYTYNFDGGTFQCNKCIPWNVYTGKKANEIVFRFDFNNLQIDDSSVQSIYNGFVSCKPLNIYYELKNSISRPITYDESINIDGLTGNSSLEMMNNVIGSDGYGLREGNIAYTLLITDDNNKLYINENNLILSSLKDNVIQSHLNRLLNLYKNFDFYSFKTSRCLFVDSIDVGDPIVFYKNNNGEVIEYDTIAQIDWKYNTKWYGGFETMLDNKFQEETQVVSLSEKVATSIARLTSKIEDVEDSLNDYVLKSGDVMSGELFIEKNKSSTGMTATRTDKGVGAFFGVGSSGTRHGFYSEFFDKWILMTQSDTGDVVLNNSGLSGGKFKLNDIDFTTAKTGSNALINALDSATATPTDSMSFITNDANSGGTTWYKRTFGSVWNYILNKIKGNPKTTRNRMGMFVYSPTGSTTDGTFTVDVSNELSSIEFAIAEVVNVSSGYTVIHTSWSGTNVRLRYGKRNDMANNTLSIDPIPVTRVLVIGVPK